LLASALLSTFANICGRQQDGVEDGDEDGDENEEEDEEDEDDRELDEEEEEEGRDTAVIDFVPFSKSAWALLNTSSYTRLSDSKQYDAAFKVFDKTTGFVEAIREQTTDNSSYGTKLNALEALSHIGETVLSGNNNDRLGAEVRKQFQFDTCVVDVLLDIVKSMTPTERLRAADNDANHDGTLLSKLEWLRDEAKDYCVDGLEVGGVVALLGGDPVEAK